MRLLSAAMTLSAAPFRHSYCSARHAPLIIDTDCGLDDLATLVFAAATATPISLVTTTSGLAPPGRGHSLARSMLDYVGLQDVRVVAGAEMPPPGVVREKAEWEMTYQQRVADVTAAMGLREAAAEAEVVDAGDAGAAADAILSAARESGGNATVLALGALTNVALSSRRHGSDFSRLVRRMLTSSVARLEVLGSGVEVVLVGQACYAKPAWALLYHLQPDAFAGGEARVPVRVSGDTSTAAGWRPDGHVIELAGVSLERYAEFVRSACTYRG
ncbi:hypothetical protein EMIHUDRAFT_229891 [Emiliania huxleyi CCMP1516]|uniref:Inosine/uridine-preferring nucleoside hydrolase domain-containing protein n=2 Tax=Emiliania huxleyi TaxID=2903 RepID=A0A0D3KC47_EMIH1|nr:hypothetical protein EMIHUDRAFT_229891 [Emiliania huxleyi CCMP1516]EOD33332.1 hypothetical protein EMIHUDRAFT_229891 [Emiliania huxleyi CCMP1516]|eukprot:XP_005785761.1 hypothetical protein EMIHUDRAFT_229891 [Emiliania huxleyi CCMP1516]